MNLRQTTLFLRRLERFRWKFHLEGIRKLLSAIGNPHHRLKFIHVAGSNGKGSVCAMLDSILQEAGYRVGRYTSPHLKRYNERICINGKPISDRVLTLLVAKLKPHHKRQTFFEFFTAMAMQHFAEQKVDVVVLETGLGGRLDATNVVTPLMSVITSLSLEHTDILGKSIGQIAREKAGIIKRNVPVVTSAKGKALTVLRQIARKRNSPLTIAPRSYRGKIGLPGAFQRENAVLAAATARELDKRKLLRISPTAIRRGIARARWPGRLDLRGNVLYDCAHNPDGMRTLVEELKMMQRKRRRQPVVCVFGVLQDKDWRSMLDTLSPHVNFFLFTKPDIHRALPPQKLVAQYQLDVPFTIIDSPSTALAAARRMAGRDGLVVVTGSIYLVGALLPLH